MVIYFVSPGQMRLASPLPNNHTGFIPCILARREILVQSRLSHFIPRFEPSHLDTGDGFDLFANDSFYSYMLITAGT